MQEYERKDPTRKWKSRSGDIKRHPKPRLPPKGLLESLETKRGVSVDGVNRFLEVKVITPGSLETAKLSFYRSGRHKRRENSLFFEGSKYDSWSKKFLFKGQTTTSERQEYYVVFEIYFLCLITITRIKHNFHKKVFVN